MHGIVAYAPNRDVKRSMKEMKKTIQLLLLVGLAAISTGCASTGGYFVDRGRDAADIFTASVGEGGGAKARVGPIQVGLFAGTDLAGLRSGEIFPQTGVSPRGEDVYWSLAIPGEWGWLAGWDAWRPSQTATARGKTVGAGSRFPFVMTEVGPNDRSVWSRPYIYQIEVAAGLGGTLRLGFNPGELLDFVLGWFIIDIYNDDLEWKKRTSNKTLDATSQ
jgi:hypothetical protein